MKSTIIKTTVTVGSAFLMAFAGATVVKSQSPSGAGAACFQPDEESLRQAPAGLEIVQPSHFPGNPGKIKLLHEGDSLARMVGRNVTFRDLVAEAYDCTPGRVILPPEAPTGGFDFLVTVSPKTRQHLRSALEKELGYTASSAMRDTGVFVLRVADPALPGLTASAAADSNIDYRDGKLYFTHQPVSLIVKGLEDGLTLPVLDQTGLTNNYDFSVTWREETTQAMRNGKFHLDGVRAVLQGWGLELTSEHASLEMFTVRKTR
jgi:uncharacterized protein (TIGR03435 family)